MLVLMSCTMMVMAPIMMRRRHRHGGPRGPRPVLADAVTVPVLAIALGSSSGGWSEIPADAVPDRHGQPRAARADHRHPRGPRVRPRAAETERFDGANADLTAIAAPRRQLQALMFPTVMLVVQRRRVAVLWFGGHRVAAGDIQVGALMAYLSYLMQIVMAVMMATFMMMMIPRAAVCAERIMEVLDTARRWRRPATPSPTCPSAASSSSTTSSTAIPAPSAPVLPRHLVHGWSPGRPWPSSARPARARRTLVDLVPRLFDVTAGEVRVGGVDVRDARPSSCGR